MTCSSNTPIKCSLRLHFYGQIRIVSSPIVIDCLHGRSAHRPVLLGFAPANLLYKLSFPDVFDEDSGHGYQRPFNERHSQDFRRYIKEPESSTIPLTFNLRPSVEGSWRVVEVEEGKIRLEVAAVAEKIMAQVDCQHRLGHLGDLPISLPFMCFIGLSEREEMEVFSVINSKAKGLSTSLLDYHAAQLAESLAQERPELFIALQLNSIEGSPWFRRLNLGGKTTSGLKRVVSLRMMQQAVDKFIKATAILSTRLGRRCRRRGARFLVGGRGRPSGRMGEPPPTHADKRHRRVCPYENRGRYLY